MVYMKRQTKNKVSLTRLRKAFKDCKLLSFVEIDGVIVIKVWVKQGIVTTFHINRLEDVDDNTYKLVEYLKGLPTYYREINI